jgi:hypothetical protein
MAGRGYNTGVGEKFFGVVVKKDVLQGLKPLILGGVFGGAEAPPLRSDGGTVAMTRQSKRDPSSQKALLWMTAKYGARRGGSNRHHQQIRRCGQRGAPFAEKKNAKSAAPGKNGFRG